MYCVYFHKNPVTKEIFYIGHGRISRAFDNSVRNKLWKKEIKQFKEYIVEIHKSNLSKSEAHELESNLISVFKPTCNIKTNQTVRNQIPENFKELFYVDESSPSGLRYLVNNKGNGKNRRHKNDIAGNKKYQSDGRPHAWQVMISGKCYLVHRIIWALCYEDNLNPELVIDHIDRNPFNNSVSNLRVVNYTINAENSSVKKTNKSGIKNLYIHITVDGKTTSWTAAKRINGKRYTKSFSHKKYGCDKAKILALEWLTNFQP